MPAMTGPSCSSSMASPVPPPGSTIVEMARETSLPIRATQVQSSASPAHSCVWPNVGSVIAASRPRRKSAAAASTSPAAPVTSAAARNARST